MRGEALDQAMGQRGISPGKIARSQMILRPLGDPGDPQWAGKSALWWKTRYSGYANKIKNFEWIFRLLAYPLSILEFPRKSLIDIFKCCNMRHCCILEAMT